MHPLVDPGVLRTRHAPRVPGDGSATGGRAGSPGAWPRPGPAPGARATASVPSGVRSRGPNPVPPVVTTSPANPSQAARRVVRDGVGAVGRDDALDDVEPGLREVLLEGLAGPVLARARDHPVRHRDDLRQPRHRCQSAATPPQPVFDSSPHDTDRTQARVRVPGDRRTMQSCRRSGGGAAGGGGTCRRCRRPAAGGGCRGRAGPTGRRAARAAPAAAMRRREVVVDRRCVSASVSVHTE